MVAQRLGPPSYLRGEGHGSPNELHHALQDDGDGGEEVVEDAEHVEDVDVHSSGCPHVRYLRVGSEFMTDLC